MAPPAKPLDKNATSMRILLHDTQAHFEKFTVHAEKLLKGVQESKHEIKSVQGLFERNRESLIGDIIDLGMCLGLSWSIFDLGRHKVRRLGAYMPSTERT